MSSMEARFETCTVGPAATVKSIDIRDSAASVAYTAMRRGEQACCRHIRLEEGPSGKFLILWPDTKLEERIPLTGT